MAVVAQPLEFRLLGPVGVEVDSKPAAVGGPKQQSLLACLVLRANEVVPSDQLVTALWDEPPKSATTMVQMYVSRLRKLFRSNGGPERSPRIVTQPGGYLLRVDPEAVDLFRFELLVAEGRALLAEGNPRVAAGRFREALGLWRGPALAGLVDAPLGAGESLRLEELRERRPVRGLLPQRLVEQDHARDELLGSGRREQHVAVRAPVLLRGFDADRVEALLDRAVALVRGQDPLAGSDERARGQLELR